MRVLKSHYSNHSDDLRIHHHEENCYHYWEIAHEKNRFIHSYNHGPLG